MRAPSTDAGPPDSSSSSVVGGGKEPPTTAITRKRKLADILAECKPVLKDQHREKKDDPDQSIKDQLATLIQSILCG